jgi:hypothetical protein
LIGILKGNFRRTLGRRILNYDQMNTFVADIEATLNNRPITFTSDEPNALLPLRPADFLIPHAHITIDTVDQDLDLAENLSSQERLVGLWQSTIEAVDSFWNRWQSEYLITLRERAKWDHRGPRLQTQGTPGIGDVVLVEEEFRPRNLWPIGRVIELNGEPGVVRSVKLRLATGRIVTRPVNRLCPLESSPALTPPREQPKVVEPSDVQPRIDEPPSSEPELPPITHSIHPMTTRAHTRTSTRLAAIALILTLFTFEVVSHPIINCTDCGLHCVISGVSVHTPPEIQKSEICCENSCFSKTSDTQWTFELPKEILVNDYSCQGTFWADSHRSFSANVSCAAVDGCHLLNCHFCIEQCSPPTAPTPLKIIPSL